ncbi:hypothetical protein B0H13DRAFT_2335025 [Mycena leptocephala]|nr:hypothetical protein B0H13DRAFT_2335025 [Mycena leptocephala]
MDFPCGVRSPFLSSSIRWHLLISMLLRSCIWDYEYQQLRSPCTIKADAAPPSVRPPEPSPLGHAIAIHPIHISATSLTSSNTVTAICTIPL